MAGVEQIEQLVTDVINTGAVAGHLWPGDAQFSPADLGLTERGGELVWKETPDLVELAWLEQAFPDLQTRRFDLIDSTNTRLVSQGGVDSIASHLYVAEFQYGGRGRRGRTWLSPYARNLAMSLGIGTRRALPELGGLSLVVGLALADGMDTLGVADVQLKWPNDVLVGDRKLAGILVELVQRPGAVEIVVGMGVNVSLTEQEVEAIGQPVTDLRRCGVAQSRTELVINLITRVRGYLEHFEMKGFAPFVRAFNDVHAFHGQTCSVIQGRETIKGTVSGIGDHGELILETDVGEQRFHGGEVSLRPQNT